MLAKTGERRHETDAPPVDVPTAGDLHGVNSWPEVSCSWTEYAAEKGPVANSGDRRHSDHAWRLFITQGDQGIDMHGSPRRCPRRGKHDIRQQCGG